ncbi:MAG: tetratricopeptide repeat protein [Deferribacterota bacterium]|nr:tetratricopeptide repeat protein [Deferribacterota bacterium]
MKIIIHFFLSIFFLFIVVSVTNSQQITIRKNDYVTELQLKVNPEYIDSYYEKDNKVFINFINPIRLNIVNLPDNPFIKSIDNERSSLIVNIKKGVDIYLVKQDNGLDVVLAKSRKFDSLLIKSDINAPKMIGTDINEVDKTLENKLIEIEKKIKNKNYEVALEEIRAFLEENHDGFYAIEAYYKMGDVYMKLGEKSPIYYKRAYEIFGEFIEKYPFYFRYKQALLNAAKAAYKSHNYDEALDLYKKIYDSDFSTNERKEALRKIGRIYENISQYDKALETYMDYIKRYGDNYEINNRIGYLYSRMGDYDSAYNYFYDFIHSGQLGIEDPDVLFEIARVLEGKKKYNRSLDFYNYIFNNFSDYVKADEAMLRSAKINNILGNKEKGNKILRECKDKYPRRDGGYLCALNYARKHIGEHPTEYWEEFLRSLLDSDNEDIRARALYMLLNAYYEEGKLENAYEIAKEIESEYLVSSVIDDVDNKKQDILYKLAKQKFREGALNDSERLLNELLDNYPLTKYKKEAKALIKKIEDKRKEIKINKLLAKLNKEIEELDSFNDYQSFLGRMEELSTTDNASYIPFDNLTQKVYPRLLNSLYSKGDNSGFKTYFLDYLSLVGEDNIKNDLLNDFGDIVIDDIQAYIDNDDFVAAINEYEKIENLRFDNKLENRLNELIAYALYNIGEAEKAKNYINKVTKPESIYGIFVDVVLNKNTNEDVIMNLSIDKAEELLTKLIDENPTLSYSVASIYKKNPNFALEMQYDALKNISDNETYNNIVVDFYTNLRDADEQLQERFYDIFYDAGMVYYDDENYNSTIEALSLFEKFANKDEDLQKAYYLLGESYLNINENDLARQYFSRLINNYPNTPLGELAEQELEKIGS